MVKLPWVQRSCTKCVDYWPEEVGPDDPIPTPCRTCRRFYPDHFIEKVTE